MTIGNVVTVVVLAVTSTTISNFTGGGFILDTHTQVPLGNALAIGSVLLPAVWWLSWILKGVSDRLDKLDETVKKLRCVKDPDFNCCKDNSEE